MGTYTSAEFTNLPADTFGLAFLEMGGLARQNYADVTTISFWSAYAPTWSNFFTNCGGGGNRGWNEGFLLDNPDDDPYSVNNAKILAPVPEPAHYSLLLALAAIAFLGFRKKRARQVVIA